jgi:hypothetical protein
LLEGKYIKWQNDNHQSHEMNTLEKANVLSQGRFNKDFDELQTFEKNYIIKALAKMFKK